MNKDEFKPHFTYAKKNIAIKNYNILTQEYGSFNVNQASHIIPLGGDGFMLESLKKYMHLKKPFYGINMGNVGFLTNKNNMKENLFQRINNSIETVINPLKLSAKDHNGKVFEALAINEVAIFRASAQTIHVKIFVQDEERMKKLVCDGVMVATPAGSTAYNLSAHGTIIPIESPLLALTPISPFRPRKWHGALLPSHAHIVFELIDHKKRPANLSADNREFKNIKLANITLEKSINMRILFDQNHSLEERILREQFSSQ